MERLKEFFKEHGVVIVSLPPSRLESAGIRITFRIGGECWKLWAVSLKNDRFTMLMSNGDRTQRIFDATPDVEDDLLNFCEGVYGFWDKITPDDIDWSSYLHDLKADLRNNRLWAQGSFMTEEIQGFEQNVIEIEAEIDAIYRQDYDSILDRYRASGTLAETFEFYLV